MKDKRKIALEKELLTIERQLKNVSGVGKRHKLLKRQLELKKELKGIKKK